MPLQWRNHGTRAEFVAAGRGLEFDSRTVFFFFFFLRNVGEILRLLVRLHHLGNGDSNEMQNQDIFTYVTAASTTAMTTTTTACVRCTFPSLDK